MILFDSFKDLRLLQPRLYIQVNFIKHFTSSLDKKAQNTNQDYSETILLPKTEMPIKRSAAFEQTLLKVSCELSLIKCVLIYKFFQIRNLLF